MASPTENWGSAPFASSDSLALMWDYVRYFVGQYMPFIMIVVAAFIAWAIAAIAVGIFNKKAKDDDDDDPVEYM